jgi:hypothetical protein
VRILALAALLAAAGCVNTKTCHNPVAWKPCPNTSAQPGASGTPPAIVELDLPTCAYIDTPVVTGTLHATDPDGDIGTLKATAFQGKRVNESELSLDPASLTGTEWVGDFSLTLVDMSSGMLMESTDDVVVKVVDAAGAQSVPYCNTISAVR